MKFLGNTTKENVKITSCDKVEDPKILSANLLNTKKTFRLKKYTHIRISEIGTFCPREYSIGYQSDAQKQFYIDFPMQQQFDLGSALHWYMQNKSKVFRNNFYGNWKCTACQTTRLNKYGTKYFGTKPNTKCLNCGAHPDATEYEEFYFRMDKPYRVVGKIDGIVEKDGVYRFVDFKSYWEKPKSGFPSANDVAQLSSYAHFYNFVPEEDKFPLPIDTTTSYLHYISKKFSYSESLLTYKVQPSKKLLDLILDRVVQFTKAVEENTIPKPFDPCIRAEFSSGRAKSCFMRDDCKRLWQEGR